MNQIGKMRPYLSYCSKDKLPVFEDNPKKYKSGLEPLLANMGKVFSNYKTYDLQHKFCTEKCIENKKCSKKCDKERDLRRSQRIKLSEEDESVSRVEAIVQRIIRGEDPDTVVMVEDREYACNTLALSCYSTFFSLMRGNPVIDLTRAPIKKHTFEWIYKWMLLPDRRIPPDDLVHLLRAATFLDIPELMEQCFIMLDSATFREFSALDIMYKSRIFSDQFLLNQVMSSRISKSTLIILCSREFLDLNEMQICLLLQSSTLAVNSETELFYGALHWLEDDWPTRQSSLLNVLKQIRFSYLAPRILCDLNTKVTKDFGPFPNVFSEFERPEIRKMIEDGIFYSTLVITTNGDVNVLQDLPQAKKEMMIPRRWIRDRRCPYHRPVTKLLPNMRTITYAEFAAYSETLQRTGPDYEKYFEYAEGYQIDEASKFIKMDPKHSNQNDSNLCGYSGRTESSTWDTQSIMSWIQADCPNGCRMNFATRVKNITSTGLQASKEAGREKWRKTLKDFKPSEIWENWEKTYLNSSSDDSAH